MLKMSFVPSRPFAHFKWKWGSFLPTENLNDPLILLGMVYKLNKLEGNKYNSKEFSDAMKELQQDIQDIKHLSNISIATRTGDRNIMRNSGQYWKATNLIVPRQDGIIELTDLGRHIANRTISQSEFSSIVIQTFTLPNKRTMDSETVTLWQKHGINIFPLRILLQLARDVGYITPEEIYRIVVPLSGVLAEREDYANFVKWYRDGSISLKGWPNCTERANDKRAVSEFLRFLCFFGFLTLSTTMYVGIEEEEEEDDYHIISNLENKQNRFTIHYYYNTVIDGEILRLLSRQPSCIQDIVANRCAMDELSNNAQEMDRKRLTLKSTKRQKQSLFRNSILKVLPKCIISNNKMSAVLEAAHIIPYRYDGEDSVNNGVMLRTDIHILFDSGHLRIAPDGNVFYSEEVQKSYGTSIPDRIFIPEHVNRDFLRWRWENFTSL